MFTVWFDSRITARRSHPFTSTENWELWQSVVQWRHENQARNLNSKLETDHPWLWRYTYLLYMRVTKFTVILNNIIYWQLDLLRQIDSYGFKLTLVSPLGLILWDFVCGWHDDDQIDLVKSPPVSLRCAFCINSHLWGEIFCDVSWNKLLSKYWNCRWFETPRSWKSFKQEIEGLIVSRIYLLCMYISPKPCIVYSFNNYPSFIWVEFIMSIE